MTTYRIERVARRGKLLRHPELMHSRIVAENAASALAAYLDQYPTLAKLDELHARPWPAGRQT